MYLSLSRSRLLCGVTSGITNTHQYLKNKRCGVEIVARFQIYVFSILKNSAAWHWHLSYALRVFAVHPLSVCDVVFESVVTEDRLANGNDEF